MLCDNCPSVEPELSSELLSRELLAHVRRVAHSTVASPPQWLPNGCWPRRGSSHAHTCKAGGASQRRAPRARPRRQCSCPAASARAGPATHRRCPGTAAAAVDASCRVSSSTAMAAGRRKAHYRPRTCRLAIWPFGHLVCARFSFGWADHLVRPNGNQTIWPFGQMVYICLAKWAVFRDGKHDPYPVG